MPVGRQDGGAHEDPRPGGGLHAHADAGDAMLISRWWQGVTFGAFVGEIGAVLCLLGGAACVAAWFAFTRARQEMSLRSAQEAQGNLVPEDVEASAD